MYANSNGQESSPSGAVSDSLRQSFYNDHQSTSNPFAPSDVTATAEAWGGKKPEENVEENEEEEEDDDDTPIVRSPQSRTPAPVTPQLAFSVNHLVDRSKRTPHYTFDVLTNISSYRARKYTAVSRNQAEFGRLEAHLRATYPECIVPTLGSGSTTSKYVPDYQNNRLVVMLLQQWLNRVAAHPILRQDYELRQFVEAKFAFNPSLTPSVSQGPTALSVAPLPGSGGGGFFNWGRNKQPKLARSANPTPFELELERVSGNMESFRTNLAETRRWHGRLARTRLRLSVDLGDVGTKLVSVGVIEHNPQLSRSMKRLGRGFLHTGTCVQSQANLEGSRAIAVQDIYTMATGNVQRALTSRQTIFTEHQVAERQMERKRQSMAVLRSSSNINSDQVQETLNEFNAVKGAADSKRQRAERVDRVLAADMRAFEHNREGDFRTLFGALARDQLQVERQVLDDFKAVLEFLRNSKQSSSSSSSSSLNK